MIEAVTGTGKTNVGIAAISKAFEDQRKSVVLVPTIGLMNQWHLALSQAIPSARIGRRGDSHREGVGEVDVLISVINSASRSPFVGEGALIVADEVHRYGAPSFAAALSDGYEWRLGLTATLMRNDEGVERVLLPYFGSRIVGCSYERAYRDKLLAPVKIALAGVELDPAEDEEYQAADKKYKDSRRTLIGKYGYSDDNFAEFIERVSTTAKESGSPEVFAARNLLSALNRRREILSDCHAKTEALSELSQLFELSDRSLVFAEHVKSAEGAAEMLSTQGVSAQAVSSQMSSRERREILANFASGGIKVLCAPRILDEGIDVPEADTAVIISASRTKRQMIQRMGRVIRPKADGRAAIFLVLYAKGTMEDPAEGMHSAFLDEIEKVADESRAVSISDVSSLIHRWRRGGAAHGLGSTDDTNSQTAISGEVVDKSNTVRRSTSDAGSFRSFEKEASGVRPGSKRASPASAVAFDLVDVILDRFEHFSNVASHDEITASVANRFGCTPEEARWKIAAAELDDFVSWAPINGVMFGVAGRGLVHHADRIEVLKGLQGMINQLDGLCISDWEMLLSDAGSTGALRVVGPVRARTIAEMLIEPRRIVNPNGAAHATPDGRTSGERRTQSARLGEASEARNGGSAPRGVPETADAREGKESRQPENDLQGTGWTRFKDRVKRALRRE